MTTTISSSAEMHPAEMHVVHARAGGLDVHKLQVTASVRLCQPGGGVQCATRTFDTVPADYGKLLVDRNAPRWLRKLEEHGYPPDMRPCSAPSAP